MTVWEFLNFCADKKLFHFYLCKDGQNFFGGTYNILPKKFYKLGIDNFEPPDEKGRLTLNII